MVRVLPNEVVSQIAAGEVVGRPCNVLKELIENSVDADAKVIDVQVEGCGLRSISVRDDGCGMCREDAQTCLKQHATSKIFAVGDITGVSTMGFRGEAIPSIASVSRLRIVTAEENGDGTEVVVACGGEPSVSSAGFPKGTLVEVRDLFCNVPARRKFLKSPATEMRMLLRTFMEQALARPEIAFRLSADGEKRHWLAAATTPFERIVAFYGEDVGESLLEVYGCHHDIVVTGFVQIPQGDRPGWGDQYVFVNGRPASNPVIRRALQRVLAKNTPENRPFAMLFVTLPPEEVDVNVHPSKAEVRFRNSNDVYEAVSRTVQDALRSLLPQESTPDMSLAAYLGHAADTFTGPMVKTAERMTLEGVEEVEKRIPAELRVRPVAEDLPFDEQAVRAFDSLRAKPTVLAVTQSGLIVAEYEKGICFFSVEAALEIVLAERIRKDLQALEIQPLLVPLVMDLTPPVSDTIRQHKSDFDRTGFDLDELGGGVWKVNAVPALLGAQVDVIRYLFAVVTEDLGDGIEVSSLLAGPPAIARLFARVRARSCQMTGEMARRLLDDLSRARNPYLRPSDGSSVVVSFTVSSIYRRMGRK